MSLEDTMQYIQNFQWKSPDTFVSHAYFPFAVAFGYLGMILIGPLLMKGRKPMRLRNFSIVYNIILVVLSLFMFVGVTSILLYKLISNPTLFFYSQFCHVAELSENGDEPVSGPLGWICYIYYLTKYLELIDTFLLIVKGKKIIFLHAYHHFTMLTMPYYMIEDRWVPGSWWVVFANTLIHTFMYYYYLQTTINKDVHIWWKKHLTTAQIIQFFTGIVVTIIWCIAKFGYGIPCSGGARGIIYGNLIVLSFLILFINFYIKLYRKKEK